MIVLGIVLIIIGWLTHYAVVEAIGVILAVIGLVLTLLGVAGRGLGGRKTYF